jgi:hypothetical protein
MEINAKTAERIIKLRKNISNIEYINELRKAGNGKEVDGSAAKEEHERLMSDLNSKGYVFVLPFAKRLEAMSEIAGADRGALLNGLRSRAGPVWEKILEKNSLFSFYMNNTLEIALLSNTVNRLPEAERERMRLAVEAGNIDAEMEIPYLHKELERMLNRVGIACVSSNNKIMPGKLDDHEVKMTVKDRGIWVPSSQKEMVMASIKEWEAISTQIQVKNAKRQIMQFEGQDEQDFQTLQLRYLELIKKMDEILLKYGS